MHERGDVVNRCPVSNRVRTVPVRVLPRNLGVHPNDAEVAEEPWPDLVEAFTRGCRDRDGGEVEVAELAAHSEVTFDVGDSVSLGRDEEGGKTDRERVPVWHAMAKVETFVMMSADH